MPDVNDHNRAIIDEFRANDGKLGGNFEGAPVLLLHSTGAKSGKPRVNPMMYLRDGERLVVFASKAGAPTNPDWYHNLVANPDATVEVGAETFAVHATVLIGAERDRLFAKQAQLYPGFKDYEARTTRTIPVVALTRTSKD
jgi:deazaflavin-dependent oxidoreductase (nitroreductase family)